MVDAEVQVNFDENVGEYDDAPSSGIDTASVTERTNVEDFFQATSENVKCKKRTCDQSLEAKNFSISPLASSMENYVAIRLASTFLPSPLLDRRTVL